MEFFSLLKENAKRALSGQWSPAIAIVLLIAGVGLLFSFFEMVCTIALDLPGFMDILDTPKVFFDDVLGQSGAVLGVSTLTLLLSYVILTPLKLGELSWYYEAGKHQQEGIASIFEYFGSLKLFLRSVLLNLAIGVRVALVAILLTLPALICFVAGIYLWQGDTAPLEKMLTLGIFLGGAVLLAVGVLLTLIYQKRYFVAPYLVASQHEMSIGKALKASVIATKGRQCSLVLFDLSFIGWYLLSVLVLPLLFVRPYLGVARGLYARFLIERLYGMRPVTGRAPLSHTEYAPLEDQRPEGEAD